MSGLIGEAAVLADPYPLRPHVTLRKAGPDDAPCACGAVAGFVLLEVDCALEPPQPYDLSCRICNAWRHMLVSACKYCLPEIVERTVDDFGR